MLHIGLVYCSGLAGAGVLGWREHVEWLDGIEEDSGDTNIYILTSVEGVK